MRGWPHNIPPPVSALWSCLFSENQRIRHSSYSLLSVMVLKVLHTQKTRQVFLNPEPNFWVSFAVSLPASQRSKKDEVNAECVDDCVPQGGAACMV